MPGKKFFYWSQLLGWAIPAVLFTATMTVTGASFRFGQQCHINHEHAMADFWAWLIIFSGGAIILQLATVGYCLHVYVRNLVADDDVDTEGSGEQTTSYQGSTRTQSARAMFNRIRRVLWLQWRGMLIVTNLLFDIVFFTVVFNYLDDNSTNVEANVTRAQPWLTCLVAEGGDKNKCITLASEWLVSESVLAAVIVLLSLAGIELFFLLFRRSLLTGWREFITTHLSRKQEFVSLDARNPGAPTTETWSPQAASPPPQKSNYEMQRRQAASALPSKEYGSSTIEETASPIGSPDSTLHKDYFPRAQQTYTPSPNRYSGTSSAGSRTVQSMGWDPLANSGGDVIHEDSETTTQQPTQRVVYR